MQTYFPDSYPNNDYYNQRLADGDAITDIFDDTDYLSKCHTIDTSRPICVQVGKYYNYVHKKSLLFDEWFVFCKPFKEYGDITYAYRRFKYERRDGGVILRKNGTYVTQEEFLDIKCGWPYSLVRQKNHLFNVINNETGEKVDKKGIDVDCIAFNDDNYTNFDIVIVEKGHKYKLDDPFWYCSKKTGIKYNFYSFKTGLLSPNQWFDYVESFPYIQKYRSRSSDFVDTIMYKYAPVYINNKVNFIDNTGKILSDIWFDGYCLGEAVILKSPFVKELPSFIDENFTYNPEKFIIYTIDKEGIISKK